MTEPTIETRPMTSQERADVERAERTEASGCLGAGIVLALLAVFVIGVPSAMALKPSGLAWVGYLCGGLAGGIALVIAWRLAALRVRDTQKRLQAGEVEVVHCEPTAAVALAETDSAGHSVIYAYALQVAPRQVLFLDQHACASLVKRGVFPNDRLAVVRLPHTGTVIAVDPLGEPFSPSETLALPEGQIRYPLSGKIEALALDELEARLRRSPKKEEED